MNWPLPRYMPLSVLLPGMTTRCCHRSRLGPFRHRPPRTPHTPSWLSRHSHLQTQPLLCIGFLGPIFRRGDRFRSWRDLCGRMFAQVDDSVESIYVPAHAHSQGCRPDRGRSIPSGNREWRPDEASSQSGCRTTAVMALPRPTSCAPRSPVMSPLRGNGRGSHGRRPRRRVPWTTVPAAAAARFHG